MPTAEKVPRVEGVFKMGKARERVHTMGNVVVAEVCIRVDAAT